MASIVYNIFKTGIMLGSYGLDKDIGSTYPVFCALLNNSYTPDADHKYAGEFIGTYEIAGTAYVAGGAALSSPEVTQDDTDDEGVFDAGDALWGTSSITARYGLLYSSTGVGVDANGTAHTSDPLICCFDFTSDKSSSEGNFKIQWNAEGILNIT